jgi:hypothetical protein
MSTFTKAILLAAALLNACAAMRYTYSIQEAKQPKHAYRSVTVAQPLSEVKRALLTHEKVCGEITTLKTIDSDFVRYSSGPYGDPNQVWAVVEMEAKGETTQINSFAAVHTWRPFADKVIAAVTDPTMCS